MLYNWPMRTHIHPLEKRLVDDKVERAVEIELPTGDRQRLWYRFPQELDEFVTDSLDPFVIGCIFTAMSARAQLVVHANVSPSLIRNLLEFQNYWYAAAPQKYARIEIECDSQVEMERIETDRSICAFTGGIDSSYSIYRHASGLCGQMRRNIEAALFVHGFDIPLSDTASFSRAFELNQNTLEQFGIKLFSLQTNHQELNQDWNFTHGAGIVSSLSFFQKHFSEGVVPATYSYMEIRTPWGSNPISDHLMGSRNFSIFHDGAVWNRGFKLFPLKDWKLGYDRLRVCYSAAEKDKNCGKCEKCILTMLTMLIFKCPLPQSFPTSLCKESFNYIGDLDEIHLAHFENLLHAIPYGLPFKNEIERMVKLNRKRISKDKQKDRTKLHFQLATAKLKEMISKSKN